MDWVATHTRYAAPGSLLCQCRMTWDISNGHSSTQTQSSATDTGCLPSSESRVPSTPVAAMAVSAGDVSTSWRQRSRSVTRWRPKTEARASQTTAATKSSTREAHSTPRRCSPTESTAVAITAAPAAGGRSSSQSAQRGPRLLAASLGMRGSIGVRTSPRP